MNIYFIEDLEKTIAFHKETFDFFVVDPMVKKVVEYADEHGKNAAAVHFEMDKDTIDDLYMQLGAEVENRPEKEAVHKTGVLNRLVLNLSNDCNLACKYCYANGGSYQSESAMMSEATAIKALDRFYEQYEVIESIQLFGGEPLLNVPVIRTVLEYIEEIASQGRIEAKPTIGIVTNGMLLHDEVINLIQKYDMKVTVSIDGGEKIHDCNRVDNEGHGSYAHVMKNVSKLRERTNQPETIEVTYNKQHEVHGVSVLDAVRQINADSPGSYFHVTPVSTPISELQLDNYVSFISSVDDVFDTYEAMEPVNYSLVDRFIKGIREKKQSHYICTAGFDTLSVAVDGTVYPCFMFTDEGSLAMGSIYDQNLFKHEDFIKHQKQYLHMNKLNNKNCSSCMLQRLCTGCLGVNYYETGQIDQLHEPTCNMYVRMAERVVSRLASLHDRALEQKAGGTDA